MLGGEALLWGRAIAFVLGTSQRLGSHVPDASLARRPSPPRYAAARRSRAGLANFAAYCVSGEFCFSSYSCRPCVHNPACVSGLHHKPTQHLAITHVYMYTTTKAMNKIGANRFSESDWSVKTQSSANFAKLDPLCRARRGSEHARLTRRYVASLGLWDSQTPVAFYDYGVPTPSRTTVSPILGFIVYIPSIWRSKSCLARCLHGPDRERWLPYR